MSIIPGISILLVFLVLAGLMISRKMPALIALPIMAVIIAIIAGMAAHLPWSAPAGTASLQDFLFTSVLQKGSGRLIDPMLYAIFGAILSHVVMRQGIAQRIVRVAAEFAGDKKMLLAFIMTAAVAAVFTSLTGLGAVIMVGSLALPIMVGSGLSAPFAACLLLFGISLGGILNGANMGFYTTVLQLDLSLVKSFARVFVVFLALTATAFIVVGSWRERKSFGWAMQEPLAEPVVPLQALPTPLLPVVLIMAVNWPIIPSFIAAILYGCLTTQPARLIPNLTAATLEGLKEISPVLGLFMGIGMTLNAMTDPTTSTIMTPFMTAIVPSSAFGYVLFFTLLAPLTLYRGPLNLIGLGAGFAVLVLNQHLMSPVALMAAFMATGQMQGICDPTNTHNVWIAQFTHSSTDEFLKRTLPFVWVFILCVLIYTVAIGHAFS